MVILKRLIKRNNINNNNKEDEQTLRDNLVLSTEFIKLLRANFKFSSSPLASKMSACTKQFIYFQFPGFPNGEQRVVILAENSPKKSKSKKNNIMVQLQINIFLVYIFPRSKNVAAQALESLYLYSQKSLQNFYFFLLAIKTSY